MTEVLYKVLVLIRFLQPLVPQPGYIHPDEFFQSPEIVAGNVFDFAVLKTWEFTGLDPIRNIVLPYVTTWPPFYVIKVLNTLLDSYLGCIISAKTILIAQKMFITTLSFATDWSIWKICRTLNINHFSCLCLHASSYVTMVFYNRTLSNTIETFLFALLLKYVVTDTRHVGQDSTNNNQPKFSFVVAVVLTVGIFNRPTFLIFAIVPFCYWLFVVHNQHYTTLTKKITSSISTAAFVSLFLIICDSHYYKSLLYRLPDIIQCAKDKQTIVSMTECLSDKLVVTPMNFILYNMDSANLANHGTHPRWTHLIVNSCLLFGTSALIMIYETYETYCQCRYRSTTISSEKLMLLLSYWVPLLSFSIFSHQEPRFLIPLIIPVCLITVKYYTQSASMKALKYMWILINMTGFVFYGYLHQGGIIPSLTHLQQHLVYAKDLQPNQYIIYYKTYMPPRYLLTIPSVDKKINVIDLAGAHQLALHKTIVGILHQHSMAHIHVVLPNSIDIVRKTKLYQLKLDRQFGPHISMENLPVWQHKDCDSHYECVCNWMETFYLNVYKVHLLHSDKSGK